MSPPFLVMRIELCKEPIAIGIHIAQRNNTGDVLTVENHKRTRTRPSLRMWNTDIVPKLTRFLTQHTAGYRHGTRTAIHQHD